MKFTLIFGFLAGLAGALGFAYQAPYLEQQRVRAISEVVPNGGRLERFQIRLADDVLMQAPGVNSDALTIPEDAEWFPELAPFAGLAAVYRLRNERDEIVGVASRVRGIESEEQVEWILYLPARGLLALDGASVDTVELGDIASGDREFAGLAGDWKAWVDENDIWRFETVVREPSDDEPETFFDEPETVTTDVEVEVQS
ncbi:MAG: hypothetical protein AAAFM81_04110 [Pseudomonadota bacterium]